MRDHLKIIVIVLLVVNLVVPYFVFSFGFARGSSAMKANKLSLQKIKDNNVKIAAFLAGPDVVAKFSNLVTLQKEKLKGALPRKVEMITAQKVFSQLAKKVGVSIVSLKPLKDGDPFTVSTPVAINEKKEKGKSGKEPLPPESTGFLTALLQIKLRGPYVGIVEFVHQVEQSEDIVVAIESLDMKSILVEKADSEEVTNLIELNMIVKLFYSS